MPQALPIITTVGAVVGAGVAVKQASTQASAQKKAKGEAEAIDRINQVNEIKAITAQAVPTGSNEFLAFLSEVDKNRENVANAQEASRRAISAFQERIKGETKEPAPVSNDVSALGLPAISNLSTALADLSVLNNKIDSINPSQRVTQVNYTPYLIAGGIGILLILLLKKRL